MRQTYGPSPSSRYPDALRQRLLAMRPAGTLETPGPSLRVLRANRATQKRWRRGFWAAAAAVLVAVGGFAAWSIQGERAEAGIRPLFVERMNRTSSTRTLGHREAGRVFRVGEAIEHLP